MIYHHVRMTPKPETTAEQREEVLESLRAQGREIDAVEHFVVGREVGGDFEWAATFAIADLDGYAEYLVHPAHTRTRVLGHPLAAAFTAFDTTDDPDPGIGAEITALQQRLLTDSSEV